MKTSLGNITIELDEAKAPVTVKNFLAYVDAGAYDGTIFHRVIDGFMIQGGGFDADLQRRPSRAPIKNEAGNGLKNRRGTIAMARTSVVDSATNQFSSISRTMISSITRGRMPGALAMPSSVGSRPAWRWSIALPRCRPGRATDSSRTCRSSR